MTPFLDASIENGFNPTIRSFVGFDYTRGSGENDEGKSFSRAVTNIRAGARFIFPHPNFDYTFGLAISRTASTLKVSEPGFDETYSASGFGFTMETRIEFMFNKVPVYAGYSFGYSDVKSDGKSMDIGGSRLSVGARIPL